MIERKQFRIFGFPSEALKEILDGFNASYYEPIDGFSRSEES